MSVVYWWVARLTTHEWKYSKIHADNGEHTHCGRKIPSGAVRVFKNVDKTKDTSDFCKKCWDI